jgi:hypothetical protein
MPAQHYPRAKQLLTVNRLPLAAHGLMVFFVSVWFIVPSGFWVTVFSFVLTAPVGLTRVSSVLEIVRAHPAVRSENPSADIAAKVISLC